MNGVLLVNKPVGITSHDLVQKARRLLKTSRIGHTGTLDPLAEGLMILTIGKATKILPFMSHYFKEYIATMQLGKRSDTLDCTGEILETREYTMPSREEIIAVLNSFLGESEQLPPMYSAKKYQGQHLYDLARNNIEVERKKQKISIREIELLDFNADSIVFRVVCSTGTYVRVLIEDIAERMGQIALMSSLKRTKIDRFDLKDAWQLSELNERIVPIDVYDVLNDHFYYEIDDPTDVYNGKRIQLPEATADLVMITKEREILAAYEKDDDGYYYCKRGLW